MEGIPNWDSLTWQEKREERFKVWLAAPDVQFVNEEAKIDYRQRVTRFIKAIRMEEPDRVPVQMPTGNFPASWAGVTLRSMMHDFSMASRAWIAYMDAFGDMDSFFGPDFVPAGKISEVLKLNNQRLPGLGLPEDSMLNQFVEGEYMKADEYDRCMADPSDYTFRVNMPRMSNLFAPFAKFPPLHRMVPGSWIALLAVPEIRTTFQTLLDLADVHRKHEQAGIELSDCIKSRGYPSMGLGNFGLMVSAPFDHFADGLRGTHGIILDLYRQPEKLLEAMDRWLDLTISTVIKNYPMTASPVYMIPLHKGDDTFMSESQFGRFYWPTLRRLLMAIIEEGLVPMPFAEGKYNNRLSQIADTPKSGVVWYFDQTDMANAKKILGDTSCIVGNVPSSLIKTGTQQDVTDCCRHLIEACAPGGGYVLTPGATIDVAPMENLQAMMMAANNYGRYE